MPPVIGQSTDPKNAGVTGDNSGLDPGAIQTQEPTGVIGVGQTGIAALGIQTGIKASQLALTPNFVAVRGDGGGIPGVAGFSIPTFGVIGITASGTGIGVQGVNQSGGTAGDFQGNVTVSGQLKVGGSVEFAGPVTAGASTFNNSITVDGPIQTPQKTPVHFNHGIIIEGPALTGGLSAQITGDVEVSGNVQAHDFAISGGDFAEEFDLPESHIEVDLGTVMVLDEKGAICPSYQAYDKKVVGVISGAGDYKPGIVLDRRKSEGKRVPVALVGKVYCKADATGAPIEIGDLVTTSSTPGHAMKARNPSDAFGAVIGKALGGLEGGQGLIPILVSLQ